LPFLRFASGTATVALTVSIGPGIEFKTVKSDAALTDRNLTHVRTHLAVESIPIHAQIATGVPKPNKARRDEHLSLDGHNGGRPGRASADLRDPASPNTLRVGWQLAVRTPAQEVRHFNGSDFWSRIARRGQGGASEGEATRKSFDVQSKTSERSQPTTQPRYLRRRGRKPRHESPTTTNRGRLVSRAMSCDDSSSSNGGRG